MPGALDKIEDINARVLALENEVAELKTALRSNTAVTNQIKTDTAKIIDMFNAYTTAMHMGMKFTTGAGRFLQWIANMIAAGGVVYVAWISLKAGVSSTIIPSNHP